MKMSRLFVETKREFPNDAEAVSHKLLVRAGFIKKLTNGIYTYMPLAKRVLSKISDIVREEMNKSGAQELLMPFVQPAEVWQKSGRWQVYGKELLRCKDRHDNDMCLAPTHEEVITSVVSDTVHSYKDLPLNVYQIATKFRDEIRARFGLLRGREFIMKDAYSFHTSQEDLEREYKVMAQTYTNIFKRCGLETKVVQSDSGAIGGAVSHEYMVLTDTAVGENDVFYCEHCDYSANSNHAISILPEEITDGAKYGYTKEEIVDTPNTKTIEELAKFLKVNANCILKAVAYIYDSKPAIVMIRGDKEVEETKLMNALNALEIRPMEDSEVRDLLGFEPGFISYKNVDTNKVKVLFDNTTKGMKNFVVGGVGSDKHLVGANLEENIKDFVDISLVKEGEYCPICHKPLKVTRGIEVGNIFQLGTKYSAPMNACYTDEQGQLKPFIMGCYGIGVSRTMAAAIEKYHDEFGIIWPMAIAPYQVDIVPVNIDDEMQSKTAYEIYEELTKQGIEVIIDDRIDRAGVKFKDSELIGFPIRITVGKTISEGLVEYKTRLTGDMVKLSVKDAINKAIEDVKKSS
ncbi:MAG: proline--tRNA ligase [Candidatus Gastranaerophilales bacterium]|nr:proline--tRNA ligase [Candidatus Gastranaerophilales bacterium]